MRREPMMVTYYIVTKTEVLSRTVWGPPAGVKKDLLEQYNGILVTKNKKLAHWAYSLLCFAYTQGCQDIRDKLATI